MNITRRRTVFAAAMAPALASAAGRAFAQAGGHYKDKVVIVNVGGGASGGHNRYARLIQPYLQKHLGAREVRVVTMPGGGGLKAANYVWRAKPDGLNLFLGNASTLILAHLAGSAGVTYDLSKFVYLGRATSEPRVLCVGAKSTVKGAEDLPKLKRPFVYPSQGTDEDFYTMAVLGDALGFKVKAVTGYEGNADTALAVIKGDGDGHITSWSESQAAIRVGDKMPILMVTTAKSPEYPNIPLVTDIAPPAKRDTVRAMAAILETHRSYIGPPGMPANVIAEFRAAFNAALKDPALIEETRKGNRPVEPMDGARQQVMMAEIVKASERLTPILKAAVKDIQ